MLGAVALLLMFTATATAQEKTADGAKKLTDHLKTQLALNDSQYAKVSDINRVYLQKAKENGQSINNKLDKAKKLKALDEERDTKLQSVLSKDQYKLYVAHRTENNKKLKECSENKEN